MAKRARKRSSALFTILMVCVAFVLVFSARKLSSFEPKVILDKSILKEKTFETEVVEVVSPVNGIKAYLFFDNTNPIISIDFLFKKTGFAYDLKGKKGISNLAAGLLTEGAGKYSSYDFKEELENKAIMISFSSRLDDFGGSLVTIKKNDDKAYELLNLALTKPRFELEHIRIFKEQMSVMIRRQTEHPESILRIEFNKEVFGEHPYANNPLGEIADIKNITAIDLKDFVNSKFTQDVLIVGIAGDITEEEAGKMLDEVFGALPKTGNHQDIADVEINFDGRRKSIDKKAAQSIEMFAAQGVARLDKDFYPLYIANHIFGGSGLNSRLSVSVREKEGLVYSIYSYLSANDKSKLIRGSFSSTPENINTVHEMFGKEWAKMAEGVTQEELDDAKNYLISSYNLHFAAISDIAVILTSMQKENFGIDFLKKRNSYVQNVSLQDVNDALEVYFKNNRLIFVSIGNKDENI